MDQVFGKREDSEIANRPTKPKPKCPKQVAAEKRAIERAMALRDMKLHQMRVAAKKESPGIIPRPILDMLEEMTALTTNERNGGIKKR